MGNYCKKMMLLFVCVIGCMSIYAQNETKEYYLTNAKIYFDKGEYQEARSFIVKYAIKDGDKQIAKDMSAKCKTCEEYLSKANAAYVEGDRWTAEQYYTKLKELNPQHPNIQQLIDKCQKKTTKGGAGILVGSSANNQLIYEQGNSQVVTTNSKEKQHRKSVFKDESYSGSNKNKYIAWNIVGVGYPWNIVSGVEYRGGGVVGFGLYGDIGADFTSTSVGKYGHCTITNFRYAGGLKFYPYMGLFLDFGYGTIVPTTADVQYSYYLYIGKDDKREIRKMISTGHGLLLHAGYNLVTGDLSKNAGFFLGFSGGLSYDVVNKKTSPSINLKFGMAWGR